MTFHLPRPQKPRSPWPITRPDCENLVKGLADSWSGVLWVDDSQIVALEIRKVYARDGAPGVEVEVEAL